VNLQQSPPVVTSDSELTLARNMAALAQSVLATFKRSDSFVDLDSLFRLQIAAGQYAEVGATIDALLRVAPPDGRATVADRMSPYQMFATAKASNGVAFQNALGQEFRRRASALDDQAALRWLSWSTVDVAGAERDFRRTLARRQPDTAATAEALALIRQYVVWSVFRDIEAPVAALIAEDNNRRYMIQDDVLIKTTDSASISAVVVRPRAATGPLPTAFTFTIYATTSTPLNAWRAASYGYAGVVAFTRGKGHSPDAPVPYEHDGADARAVMDWIVKQPWSNGAIGMFGGSYDGFTQWAAAKEPHPALKTIVPYVAAMPGLGLPMENNVFLNANYGWAFYVTNNKYLDEDTYNNPQRWSSLNARWYASGRSYREYDRVDGTPNNWLQRWLNHPAFDRYWQAMTTYGREFSHVTIPVLSITGYYDEGQISALQYLKEHYKYDKYANHYLLIGPWDHLGSQAATKPANLRGYAIDPVAQVNTPEITFQWLDYVMRGGKKPALLTDRINYEEMGSNTWKHAASLDAMHNQILTLYLTGEKSGQYYRLALTKPGTLGFLDQTIDFSDRGSQTNDYYPAPIVGKKLDLSSASGFISEPFDTPASIAGTMAGVLHTRINKRDMDVGVVLYEMLPSGELVHLTYFLGRASFAKEMSTRRVLSPDKDESIPFERTRLVSRMMHAGSRLLVVLNVNKNNFHELNYGTGRDVSEESIADAGTPLTVEWRNDSFVKIPIWK
jgi:putative CocE/NonD family hydrolase